MIDDTAERERSNQARPRRSGLGRGLDALIPTSGREGISSGGAPPPGAGEPLQVGIDDIITNPYQPRTHFDEHRLEELADSIRTHGIMQPLIVSHRDEQGRYVLIAGERRWRASRLAGLTMVPVVVKQAVPQAMLELALVENVVRADLSPLEEAVAYKQLMEEFGLSQGTIAERVGRSRVAISNTMRLLNAPDRIQAALAANHVSEGHARALLGIPNATDQLAALDMVIERGLNVRQTEDLVRRWGTNAARTRERAEIHRTPEETQFEEQLRTALGTRVSFRKGAQGQGGTVTIQYFSDEQLQSLYNRLVGEDHW